MTVTYFNRDSRPGNYTFEQLYGAIRGALADKITIINHDLPAETNIIKSIRWAKTRAGSINHLTGDVNYLAFGLPPERTILTVHDLGHYTRTLAGWKKWAYRKIWLDGPFKRVGCLTAISEFTKRQMVEVLGVPENKITVISDPLLPGFHYSPKPFNEKQPLILQIGSGHNKNLGRLIEAVQGLDVKLLLVNRLNDPELKTRLLDSGVEFEQRAGLDFEGLMQAYRDCDLLFFASEYEGFGMPILEAQAAGRPVITSNSCSMPEVAGKGAALVDPSDSGQIRSAIETIAADARKREELIQFGLQNIRRFQLDAIAQQYLELYRKIGSS